jgi:hypothetical protein
MSLYPEQMQVLYGKFIKAINNAREKNGNQSLKKKEK